ncbi:diguanylate cyclase [Novosphingobium malaysiense]|uniref:diguanylate cyclase n=1 Tax=Novosphingobium malaysiense TaxID=1348853 RepID=A0A0B1ZUB8_9SPHN|nr:diguanylate cyclase [Novosphingobium malaysiense]
MSARDLARRQLIDDISDFLLGNDLEISEPNLSAAFGICSGDDVVLARSVTERRSSGLPITQAWLDEQCRHGEDAVSRIADKLERSLESFATTSRNARDTAAQYNSEMQVHVDKVSEAEEFEEIRNLAELARAMLDRTKHLEHEMHRSEREAAKLRSNLAKARRDADHDHLTGLPNRRAFEGLIEQHYRQAQQKLEALSVAFCDIDNFKNINDTHGHDTGDRVIQAIASSLAQISDDNCHVARHGGEEFVMLFRGTGKDEAKQRLDAVREAFAGRNFINRRTDEPIGQITFSGGVADVFAYASTGEALKAADIALYAAKEQGRNRIVAA